MHSIPRVSFTGVFWVCLEVEDESLGKPLPILGRENGSILGSDLGN